MPATGEFASHAEDGGASRHQNGRSRSHDLDAEHVHKGSESDKTHTDAVAKQLRRQG